MKTSSILTRVAATMLLTATACSEKTDPSSRESVGSANLYATLALNEASEQKNYGVFAKPAVEPNNGFMLLPQEASTSDGKLIKGVAMVAHTLAPAPQLFKEIPTSIVTCNQVNNVPIGSDTYEGVNCQTVMSCGTADKPGVPFVFNPALPTMEGLDLTFIRAYSI